MNPSRVRVFSALAFVLALCAAALPVRAQQSPPLLWFQGTRLIFDHAMPAGEELAVSSSDPGLHRFLGRLGATLAYQPQQRYAVITAEDRRTIVFTADSPSYTVGGVRARAAFAPTTQNDAIILPFYALARALFVDPVLDGGEVVLQPRVGALDVRSDGRRSTITLRAAMPLIATTQADGADQIRIAFVGQASNVAAERDDPGPGIASIAVAGSGTVRVPTTTVTISLAPGMAHHVIPTASPATFSLVVEPAQTAAGIPAPPTLVTPTTSDLGEPSPTPTIAAAPVVTGPAVTDVAIAPGDDDSLVVGLSVRGTVPYEWHRLADHRWYLDVIGATLDAPARNETPDIGAVTGVRVAQIVDNGDVPTVRIAFTLTGDQQVDLAPTTGGLTITVGTTETTDVARNGTGRIGAVGTPPIAQAPGAAALAPQPAPSPWKFTPGSGSRIIVIDPGHGGDDTGTMHNGLVEKQLTLRIAERLKPLLIAQGWTVRMTRETDIDPLSQATLAQFRTDGLPNPDDRAELQTRCDVANDIGARLFISIHINAAPVTSARGTTSYWYKPQDAPLAQAIERAVTGAAGTQDDGVRHENFYVIHHTTMPATLVEAAFITNPGDVALLRSRAFLQNVAQGIANGVKAYMASPAAAGAVSER